ncbi:MAG: hypothetical protein N2738_08310 [Thermodesulfovibrionales bacterium]|nr:hypothetical protein [Thermodesulfovibrionales bacterium]
MAGVKYKDYSEQENKIYLETMEKVREILNNGKSLEEAFISFTDIDEELKALIYDDALKIVIAERHFSKGITIEEIAESLKVPVVDIYRAISEMLEDVGHTSAEYYKQVSSQKNVGNA